MLNTIKSILGMGPKANFAELLANGGIIIDVRSKSEFGGVHVKGSINIPVDQLSGNLKKLKDKDQPIITCCASGMRSASAKGILKSAGYTNVHNGGSWMNMRKFEK
jgi:rhodanese-related sulfurtransferase